MYHQLEIGDRMTNAPPKISLHPYPALRLPNLNASNQSAVTGTAGTRPAAPARRFVFVIPDHEINEIDVARWIWETASPAGLAVLFLGLCRGLSEEPRMRRRLITLSALTRDPRITVETGLEFGANWLKTLKRVLTDGDIIVCNAEERTGLWRRPLSDSLAILGWPIWTVSGFCEDNSTALRNAWREPIFWIGSLLTLAGFFVFQVRLAGLPRDWSLDALLSLSVLVEVGLLWAWHRLSS